MKTSKLTSKIDINRLYTPPKNVNMTNEEAMGRAIEQHISGPKTTGADKPTPKFTKEELQRASKVIERHLNYFNSLWQK